MRHPTLTLLVAASLAWTGGNALAQTPSEMLASYVKQAGAPASAERGKEVFNKNFGKDYAGCAQCHGSTPTREGKDAVTEKRIGPLAPAANPKRFTDKSKVENAFSMNCRDVVGRDCTAGEKADVLAWLISLKP